MYSKDRQKSEQEIKRNFLEYENKLLDYIYLTYRWKTNIGDL